MVSGPTDVPDLAPVCSSSTRKSPLVSKLVHPGTSGTAHFVSWSHYPLTREKTFTQVVWIWFFCLLVILRGELPQTGHLRVPSRSGLRTKTQQRTYDPLSRGGRVGSEVIPTRQPVMSTLVKLDVPSGSLLCKPHWFLGPSSTSFLILYS